MGFNCLKTTDLLLHGDNLLFTTKFPRGSGTNRPQRDEGQNQPWSHPIVLNLRPLDLESSALTTRNNYFYKAIFSDKKKVQTCYQLD